MAMKNRLAKKILIPTFIFLSQFLYFSTYGATKIWTGNNNNNWNAASNWSGGAPNDGDVIIINPSNYTGGMHHPRVNASNFDPSDVNILNGAVLTIEANLTTTGIITIDGATGATIVNMTSGTLTMSGVSKQLIVTNDAVFNFSGGTINTNKELQLFLGGQFNVSGTAILNIADKLQVNGKSSTSQSSFSMSGGTTTVSGITELDGAGMAANPTVNISGGAFTATGAINWLGNSTDTPNLTVSGGTLTANSTVSSTAGLSIMDIAINGGTLNFKNSFTSANAADNATQTGGMIQFDNSFSWTKSGQFTASAGDVIFNGSTTLNSSSDFTFYNVTINTGKTISQGTTANINVKKNWVNNAGTFDAGTGKVTFSGSSFQTISNTSGTETFFDLEFNNSFGGVPQIAVNANANITNSLTMTNGTASLSGNVVTLGTSALNTGTQIHSSGWFYNGTFRRWFGTNTIVDGSANGLFPIGSIGDFRPIYITSPSVAPTTGGTFSGMHTASASVENVNIPDDLTIVRRQNSVWTISSAVMAGGSFNLRLGGTSLGVIGDVNDLRVTKETAVVGSPGTNGGTTTNPQVNRTGISLSDLSGGFYIGSVNAANSPLPVELISFDAKQVGNKVMVTWTTASEINNDFFTIEKSPDCQKIESALIVDGAGNSNEIREYKAFDFPPNTGIFYYRLKQTDFDGKYEYSTWKKIELREVSKSFSFNLLPNPLMLEQGLKIQINAPLDHEVSIAIRDLSGKEYYSQLFIVEYEEQLFEINPEKELAAGVYIISGTGKTNKYSRKLIIK